jgi:hypothetical protein
MKKNRSRSSIERCFLTLSIVGGIVSILLMRNYLFLNQTQKNLIKALGYAPESHIFGYSDNGAVGIIASSNICCLLFVFYFLYRWRFDDFEKNVPEKPGLNRKILFFALLMYAARVVIIHNILSSSNVIRDHAYVPSDIHIGVALFLPLFNLSALMLTMVAGGRALGRKSKNGV